MLAVVASVFLVAGVLNMYAMDVMGSGAAQQGWIGDCGCQCELLLEFRFHDDVGRVLPPSFAGASGSG